MKAKYETLAEQAVQGAFPLDSMRVKAFVEADENDTAMIRIEAYKPRKKKPCAVWVAEYNMMRGILYWSSACRLI